eukprot:m.225325 g.225325  ORF g.225325 m.225325 type:complete len:255 (+) comp19203_c0_seq18:94-858(+)
MLRIETAGFFLDSLLMQLLQRLEDLYKEYPVTHFDHAPWSTFRAWHWIVLMCSCLFFMYTCSSKSRYSKITAYHYVPVLILAGLSLADVIPEDAVILFSVAYMIVDGIFSTYRLSVNDGWLDQSWMFVGHHALVIPLYMHPLLGPSCFWTQKLTSRLLLIELVNFFRERWELSAKYSDFIVVYILFFLIRGIYMGWLTVGAFVHSWKNEESLFLPSFAMVLWLTMWVVWLIPNFYKLFNYDGGYGGSRSKEKNN